MPSRHQCSIFHLVLSAIELICPIQVLILENHDPAAFELASPAPGGFGLLSCRSRTHATEHAAGLLSAKPGGYSVMGKSLRGVRGYVQ
jgi:hypothetical protein